VGFLDDTGDDNASADLRDLQQFSLLQQLQYFISEGAPIRAVDERPLVVIQLLDSIPRDSEKLQLELLQTDTAFSSLWYHASRNISGHNLHHYGHFIINNLGIKRHRWVHISFCKQTHHLANYCNRINPYWKLALVFKCLTDNILLDDFRSVLQRLGESKEDGTIAMPPNSVNMDPTEKPRSADHREEAGESSSRSGRGQPPDRLSAVSGYNQLSEDYGDQYKGQGMAANSVGKLGIKIHKLPKLPT
jgi:hypothetical protein